MAVISLAEAKQHLNISKPDSDAKLTGFIAAAQAAIENRIGPLEATIVTDRVRGGAVALAVNTTPVLSLTTVTPYAGSAFPAGLLQMDLRAGVVSWPNNGYFGSQSYDIAYVAGWSDTAHGVTLPADLRLAVLEMLRHLWTSQRGGTVRPGAEESATMPGYLIPNIVASLIEPYRIPSIA